MLIILLGLTMFFSSLYLAFRHLAWVKLEEGFEATDAQVRIDWIRGNIKQLITTMGTLRMVVNMSLFLVMLYPTIVDSLKVNDKGTILMLLVWVCIKTFILVLLFSEKLPLIISKYGGIAFLVKTYQAYYLIFIFFWPLTSLLQLIDRQIERIFGSKETHQQQQDARQEELLSVVEEGEKMGVVDEEELGMIESVLEFRDTSVDGIMTPRTDIVGIERSATIFQVVDIIIQNGHSRYPIYEDSMDKITGMLYAKDLLLFLNVPQKIATIQDIIRKPFYVKETMTLRDLLHEFQAQKVHAAVVHDEYGGTAGLVTIEDILEELVGEIEDEYEVKQQDVPLKRLNKMVYEIDARYHVDELNEKLDLTLPEDEDYETVGGFSFATLGYIPKEGQTFEYGRVHFTVVNIEGRRINRIRLKLTPEPTPLESKTDGAIDETENPPSA